ncbi:MAG: site-specific recombinase [Vicinamibacteria bacterium]|nr:site-specific recombinase [Vicinamibacteria bacterium]
MKDTLTRWLIALRGGKRRDLNTILLLAMETRGRSAPEQMDWLRSLARYLRGERGFRFTPEARTHLLLQRLNQHQDWAQAGGSVIAEVLSRGSALRIYCEAGLPSSASFMQELLGRLVRSVLPPVLNEGSLSGALQQVFASRGDDVWLERIPANEREALIEWLRASIPASRLAGLVQEMAEAVWLLANRTTSIALRDEVSVRSPLVGPLAQHPMVLLEDQARRLSTSVAGGGAPDLDAFLRATTASRVFLDGVLSQVEARGVSVDLVFQMERANAYLARMERLARVIAVVRDAQAGSAARAEAVWGLLVELVRGELDDRRPGRVITQSVHLIARKTVERAGETGEEGIARSNHDLRHILTAATLGGVFVSMTALIKYIGPKGLPPFFEALYGALNYGGSFTAMHFLHLKLATKMPAMTASALSARLSPTPDSAADGEFVATATAILRTQIAAVVGNLVGVIPAALLLDAAIGLAGRGHLLAADKAAHVIESVSPWGSLTIPFAMFTGVILWIGGWVASWIDNAFVFYDVAGALRSQGGLRVRFGEKRVHAVADFLSRNVGGVAAALVLGAGLAFAPEFGRFFGLPLEVRHVTLVTGSLALSVAALDFGPLEPGTWASMAGGVAAIGICNLGVSFTLAFATALRARRMPAGRGAALLGLTLLRILRRPMSLLRVPPADAAPMLRAAR